MCVLLKSNIFGLFFVAWQSHKLFLNKYVNIYQPIPPGPCSIIKITSDFFPLPFKVFLLVVQQQQAIVRRNRAPLGTRTK